MSTPTRAILWDMDGTLVDTEPLWNAVQRRLVVEHGGSGSKGAAPIARDILIKAQQHRSARPGILPKGPDGGQQVMGPRGNKPGIKPGAKPGARSRDEG